MDDFPWEIVGPGVIGLVLVVLLVRAYRHWVIWGDDD